MSQFDRFAFNARPDFDEAATRRAFRQAVPLRTVVIYCYDPRATEIPNAVAARLGNEVYPGEVIVDEAETASPPPPPCSPWWSPAAAQSMRCAPSRSPSTSSASATSPSSTTPIAAPPPSRRAASSPRIATSRAPTSPSSTIRESICIGDYETSLRHDTALIRAHPGTPKHANVYGFFYDIDARSLTKW